MGNLGGGEILVILLAALLFLGPQKLPEAARQIGKAMGEFRRVTSGFQRELRDAMNDDDAIEARARERGKALTATPTAEQPAAVVVPPDAPAATASDAGAPAVTDQP